MGYVIKAPLGLAMFIGGLVVANLKLVSLLETGTCASGNTPYQIAQPCPSGTGTDILLLMGSIFGALIGVGLFSARGAPPWDRDRPFNLDSDFSFAAFAWGLAFTSTGAVSLIAGLTNEAVKNNAGSKLGALIVGGTFLVMGLPILLMSIRYLIHDFLTRDGRRAKAMAGITSAGGGGVVSRLTGGINQTQAAQQLASRLPWGSGTGSSFGSSGGGGTGGQIAKLERLQKLRESGALTDIEFEREKAKVLSE